MLFFGDIFLFVFLPLTLLAFYAFGRRSNATGRKFALLLASLIFYGFWSLRHVPLLLGAAAIPFIAIRWIEHKACNGGKPGVFPLLLGVVGNLGLLMVFKYAGFWADVFFGLSRIRFFDEVSPGLHSIVLPLGISFYMLQGVAAVVDRWRAARAGELNDRTPALDFFTFMTFFPQLVAGPIVRAGELIPQLSALPVESNSQRAARGLTIFSVGLAKKVLLADYCAPIVNALFDSSAMPTALDSALGTLAYTLQIYFDFSGYSDMAVGLAALFGLDIPVNFRSPYRSGSIREFWRRWHVTLSFWFRDYLYIPLGGSRRGILINALILLSVTGAAGLWHGASWTFVFWGLYHGLFILIHRVWLRFRKKFNLRAPNVVISVAATFIIVSLGWIFFRAPSFSRAIDVFRSFAHLDGGLMLLAGISWIQWCVLFVALALALFAPNVHDLQFRPTPRWAYATGLLLTCSIAGVMVYSPFIYFQF